MNKLYFKFFVRKQIKFFKVTVVTLLVLWKYEACVWLQQVMGK